jgi:hypothetical protein
MRVVPGQSGSECGPSSRELVAIEAEWPMIEAELDLLDAEIRFLSASNPCELDQRRLRRAQARLVRLTVERARFSGRSISRTPSGGEAA